MQNKLMELPIGESDITKLLTEDFIYVDKTKYVYELVKKPGKYFLSRPRRFGKSTLLSTLYQVFKGNKELFNKQWIYNSQLQWQEYPIIRMDFNVSIDVDLTSYIKQTLKNIAISYDVFDDTDYQEYSYGMYFRNLFEKLSTKYGRNVVVLIDEYDKPILDVIDNIAEAEKKRDILKGFYSVIKGIDERIQFVFLTGVSRFSKVGVFSGLNNLNDISMDYDYASVCGVTQQELEHYYDGYIQELSDYEQISYADCLIKIKQWYNGFCFSRNLQFSVYNPFSTLLLFQKREFSNYWFATGSPAFLIKLVKKQSVMDINKFDGIQLSLSGFDTFEVNNLNINALLFQTGYLTIKGYNANRYSYTLGYPNLEIERSFKENLFDAFFTTTGNSSNYLLLMCNAFDANDIEQVIEYLKQIFINLDYDIKISREQHFQNIIYLIFQLLGYMIKTEYKTERGRIDAIIQTTDNVYIFEFKLNQNAQQAINQIHENKYYNRFINQDKGVYLLGVNFDSNERCINDYLIEKI